MRNEVVCPACDEVVYPDCLVLADHCLGYTWFGLRAKWTHPTFGVVHLCEPLRRELVYARDGLRVASPPWVRWLVRRGLLRHGDGAGFTARLEIRLRDEAKP